MLTCGKFQIEKMAFCGLPRLNDLLSPWCLSSLSNKLGPKELNLDA
jgi:hypothetical protein